MASETSAERTSVFNTQDPQSILLSVNMSSVTKLTTQNYLMWGRQVRALLEGHELQLFIDDNNTVPSPTTLVDGVAVPNPAYTPWRRQDRLLYSSIIGAISLPVQSVISCATTTKEVWTILAETFGNPTRGHIRQIRFQIRTCVKGTKTISEYLRTIKAKTDELALLGKPMDQEEVTEQILAGLTEEYKPEVDAVNGRDKPISFSELHERLLNREAMILCTDSTSASVTPIVANAVDTRSRQQHRSNNNNNNYRSHPQARSYNSNNNTPNQQRFSKPYLGKCQACNVQGHSAKYCPKFRIVRGTPSAQSWSQPSSQQSSTLQPWQQAFSPQPWQPRANVAMMSDSSTWLVDSGASHHMTADLGNLSAHSPYGGGDDVLLGDGSAIPITHSGSFSTPSYTRPFFINNVLCVPSLDKNLISVFQLCKTNGVAVTFTPTYFQVRDLQTGALRLEGKPKNGTYEWPKLSSSTRPSLAFASTVKTTLSDWHSRLGHPALSILQKLVSQFQLPVSSNVLMAQPCTACSINKMHKLPFNVSTLKSSRPLEIVFSDVWTSPLISVDGFKYYVIFVDHFTRYTWLYPLKQKSQVFTVFTTFKNLVKNQFSLIIRTLYTDNGGEYIGLRTFLSGHGISHMTTPPHTPEHNGIAERRHRHIVETGLSLLSHASMPRSYWTYAFGTAVYLINRMPTSTIDFQNPFQRLFGHPSNYQKLKVFGCLCFPWLRPYASHKLDARSTPCVFLGYSITQSAYLCLDQTTSRVYTSRHVVFHETVFPFSVQNSIQSDETNDMSNETTHVFPLVSVVSQPASSQSPVTETPSQEQSSPVLPTSTPSSSSSEPAPSESAESTPQASPPSTPSPAHSPSRPATIPARPPPPPITKRTSQRTKKPVQRLNLHTTISPISKSIPRTVAEALKSPHWRKAMSDEINSHIRNHTWNLVRPTNTSNIVGCRWVFTIKRKPDGSIDRYKARLVAKGYDQRPGIDYQETFSPVVKPATIRIVLSTTVTRDWPMRQLDVNNAFLQGQLHDEVYMMQPPGFQDKDNPQAICKLQKAIYGLKQAPRAWYNELRTFLLQSGFKNSLADASLFIYNQNNVLLYMLVYVDDIIITGNSPSHISRFIDSLSTRFSLKDLGDLSYYGLHLSQNRYIADLLHKANMTTAKPVSTPMKANSSLTLYSGTTLDDATEYRTLVGSLQYLSLTRPDISFAVNKLSQFMHRPSTEHWSAVKRVLRYLAGTMSHGIYLRANNKPNLHAFTDADWGGNKDDYTSTGAYVVYLGSHLIAWSSKKQAAVSRSSTEAEYRALASTTAELCWISSLLTELGINVVTKPVIYCDNIGATYLAANPFFHSRMKHIALDYHFVRQFVQNGQLRVTHVTSADQLADALTKPLPRTRFQTLFVKIGLSSRRPS